MKACSSSTPTRICGSGCWACTAPIKIRTGRRLLIEKKAISEHPNPSPRYAFDKTIYYLFHDEVVNAWLERCNGGATIVKNNERVVKNNERVVKNNERVVKNADGSAEKSSRIKAPGEPAAQTTTETTTGTTITTTRAPTQTGQPQPDRSAPGSSSSCHLIFDYSLASLSEAQRQRAAGTLEGLDAETAQQVLDEWNQAIGSNSIRKSRWAYLAGTVKAAKAGIFLPTADLSERRQKPAPAGAPPAPARKPSPVWKSHLGELQAVLNAGTMAPHLPALRGVEDGEMLWLEAPNQFVADDVRRHLLQIEQVMRPHTALTIRVRVG